MPTLIQKQPKYSRLSGRNIAFYWHKGRKVYLPGAYSSPESLSAYHQAMADLSKEKADQVKSLSNTQRINQFSVKKLIETFLDWSKTYYT
jgi:hypothetical protein